MRIAVIGSGIAGLASAWLLSRAHEVTLFEANGYLGGHTHTHDIELDGHTHAVDSGFIVYNPRHYPLFTRLLEELGVASQPTTMSFSVRNEASGLEYNTGALDALFCQRRNLLSPRFLGMLRVLSRFELSIANRPVSLLGAAVSPDNTTFTAHLTNRPLPALGEHVIPQGVIHLERRRLLCGGRLYEPLTLTNFNEQSTAVAIRFDFAADFVDIFEVKGHVRAARGCPLAAELSPQGVKLAYRGLDDAVRTTHLQFSQLPVSLSPQTAEFRVDLERDAVARLYVEIGAGQEECPSGERYERASQLATQAARQLVRAAGSLQSSGRLFNQWVDKCRADLALLTTHLATGPYPYAGIPWFSTQFGRDAIITALQTLWLDPSLAAGVLRFLASTQATEISSFRDAEPGKILHEMRRGEMAALREIPFGRYYGGVDTTPLFVILAGAYEERTGDPRLVDAIWTNLLAAVAWIEQRLDRSATGFLDYTRAENSGLANQGWKDSWDSIFHADGRLPRGPIAVVEVQGYLCMALEAIGKLAAARGDCARSSGWAARAQHIRAAIEAHFWMPELDFLRHRP